MITLGLCLAQKQKWQYITEMVQPIDVSHIHIRDRAAAVKEGKGECITVLATGEQVWARYHRAPVFSLL
jgi:hypothetical protein